jgi:hypothetical protein
MAGAPLRVANDGLAAWAQTVPVGEYLWRGEIVTVGEATAARASRESTRKSGSPFFTWSPTLTETSSTTPLTSGEWFYQRAEDASYARAVADGDFTGFDRLMAGHDPHLLPRMAAMAVALLVALVGVAVLRARANGGASVSRATWAAAAGLVLLAATVSLVQGVLLLV